jgi:hypothetical protein
VSVRRQEASSPRGLERSGGPKRMSINSLKRCHPGVPSSLSRRVYHCYAGPWRCITASQTFSSSTVRWPRK